MLNKIFKCSVIVLAGITSFMTTGTVMAYSGDNPRINIRVHDGNGYDRGYDQGYRHHRRHHMREECRWVQGHYGRSGRWHPARRECTQVRYR